MAWEVRRFAELDSTNRYLLDEARRGAPDGLVAVADAQSAGRGRHGRSWTAPPGTSLLMSVLLRVPTAPGPPHHLSAAMALALRAACSAVAGVTPAIKWPNDLVVDGAKVAGVLAEVEGGAVVVGAGVNLDWGAHPLPPGAGALGPVDRDDLAGAVLGELGALRRRPGQVMAAYRAACETVGREVRVQLPGGALTGTALTVADDGRLVVDAGGRRHALSAGDVVHLRPA